MTPLQFWAAARKRRRDVAYYTQRRVEDPSYESALAQQCAERALRALATDHSGNVVVK